MRPLILLFRLTLTCVSLCSIGTLGGTFDGLYSLDLLDVHVTWSRYIDTLGDYTIFAITSSSLDTSDAWLGFGLNSANEMVRFSSFSLYIYAYEYLFLYLERNEKDGADMFICRSAAASRTSWVRHYYALTDQMNITLVEVQSPMVGLWMSRVTLVGGNMTCQFVRDNTFNPRRIDIKGQYMLVAYGAGL